MIIRPLTPRKAETPMVIEYIRNGVTYVAFGGATEGAEVPDDLTLAEIVSICFEPSDQMTQQIVVEPTFSQTYGEAA